MTTATKPKHELKSWRQFFEPLIRGEKKHDLRRNDDRAFQVGDLILYREVDDTDHDRYTGRQAIGRITYITEKNAPCAYSDRALGPDYCILSIEIVSD